MQAPRVKSLSFDLFTMLKNCFVTPEVEVIGCKVVDALVIALVVVVIDERSDLGFKITRQKVVFQKAATLKCLMPTLNLALSLRIIWPAAKMLHAPVFLRRRPGISDKIFY